MLVASGGKTEILALHASRFFQRLRGLIGIELYEGTGLLISPCNQVHTFFMRYPIDVVFLSGSGDILHIEENMKPYRIGRRIKNAKKVLELKGGASAQLAIKAGDTLSFEKTNNHSIMRGEKL